MFDWDTLKKEARLDIEAGVTAWTSVLNEMFGNHILCAYAKGSAVKNWDTPIDYVPIISDLDIHVLFSESQSLFDSSSSEFEQALDISKQYEIAFNKIRPKSLHTPRSQVISLNRLKQVVEYVPPRKKDARLILGSFPDVGYPSSDVIRQIDLNQILNLEDYIMTIPRRLLDRNGLDYWTIIRELGYRVSPTPTRLLTQNAEDPLDVWSWNRTRIFEELQNNNYNEIADHFRNFYQYGWNLFLSGFSDNETYRETIKGGYYALRLCLEEAKKML